MNRAIDWDFFKDGMEFLGKGFESTIDDEKLKIYWAVLKRLSREEFTWAIGDSFEHSTFFPRPAELKERGKSFYKQSSDEAQREREQEERRERDRYEQEIRDWKSDPEKVASDKARFVRLRKHLTGEHKGGVRDDCECCQWELKNPNPHEQLKNGLFASDVNWQK